ncbi:hypothetical protein HD554DRAFT_2121312 [Boletus coccyginus]|nr:hypothetical protein HD554DRAFT_2121312 [Boletus coccyginus]
MCDGMHIIPWSKSDEWLKLIIQNRPQGDEQRLRTLKSVNDIRNGIMGATGLVHSYFDSRRAAVLKTPNPILATNDVPDQHNRLLPDGTSYPSHSRYTFQWLFDDQFLRASLGQNIDAAFVSHHKPKPSDLLLHYNYGAAAVKQWGRNHSVLNDRPGVPRPQPTGTVVTSPTKHVGDRTLTISKPENARAKGNQQQPAGDGGGTSSAAAADLEQPAWDEDDVMLFFWGNSAAAMARHAKKEQERKESINKWRDGVGA